MNIPIYRKRQCQACGKSSYEQYLGNRNVIDLNECNRESKIDEWEYSGFGCLVVTEWYFEKGNGSRRIDIDVCCDCKNKLFDALNSAIENIKSEEEK